MKGRTLLGFLLIVVLMHVALAAAQTFKNPVRIPTGQGLNSVFSTDLNNDGLPDLVYRILPSNTTPSYIHTLLAQASGGYSAGPTLTLPPSIVGCRTDDVNNDGNQDLVCTESLDSCDAQILVFLGNGDGSFQSPISSGLMQSNCAFASFIPLLYKPADLNSDGFPDLMVGDVRNTGLFILLNDGAGNFHVTSYFPAAAQTTIGQMYAVDINGDGKTDLISSFGPEAWLGNGDGTFGNGIDSAGFNYCMLHDMDGDGHLDAVCIMQLEQGDMLTGTNELAILHGNADGSFNSTPIASQTFGNPLGGNAAIQTIAAIKDVNGDGIPDIIGTSLDGASVLLGQSGLKFAAPVHYAIPNFGDWVSHTSQVVDQNGDGRTDIVTTGDSGLYIAYGNADGTFQAPPAYPVTSVLGGITVADFNGDGIPDIAAMGGQSIELSLGKGDGKFQAPTALPNGGLSFASYPIIAHGNFSGSGYQDILAVAIPPGGGNGFYILFNNGDGTFSSPQQVTYSGTQLPVTPPLISDFNGDHKDDLLMTSNTSLSQEAVYVGLSNGDGSFNQVTTDLPYNHSGYTSPAVADFNKDGKLDLAELSGANVVVFPGNGDGSFNTNPTVLPIPPFQGNGTNFDPMTIAAGDFDGDGNPDIAVLAKVASSSWSSSPYTKIANAVYVFYGNGDGTFSAPVIAAESTAYYDMIYVGDVNKDGRDDLILAPDGTGIAGYPLPGKSVGVFLSEPDRLFGPERVYETGAQNSADVLADVNGDAYPDLLATNSGGTEYSSNSVSELLNLGVHTNPNLQASNTAIKASSTSFVAGTSETFTATVSGGSSTGSTPSGYVRFADQTGVESTEPLVAAGSGTATATFTTSGISPGADIMSAAYMGDGTFAPSFATVPLTVTGLPVVVNLSITPSTVSSGTVATLNTTVSNPTGSTAATPTGYIEYYDGSTVVGGPWSLSGGAATFNVPFTTLGQHTVTAKYSGDLIHDTGSASVVETVKAVPTISFNPNGTQVTIAQAATLTITVSGGSGNPTPTGSVVLSGGGYTSVAATLQNGSAAITIPAGTLPIGNYTLTATYTPDSTGGKLYLATSDTTVYNVTAIPPSFAVSGSNVTVSPGASSGNTSKITVTPAGGFTGNVTLTAAITSEPSTVTDAPTFSFGSTSPVSITGTGSKTATLTITTTAPGSIAYFKPEGNDLRLCGLGGSSLALILLLGIRKRKFRWDAVLRMVLVLLIVSGAGLGCGGGSAGSGGGGSSTPGTTAGTYTVTVTGTSGTLSTKNTIKLTVQ